MRQGNDRWGLCCLIIIFRQLEFVLEVYPAKILFPPLPSLLT
jgi:hypothetical protein